MPPFVPNPLCVPSGSVGAPLTKNADVKLTKTYMSSFGIVLAKMVMLNVLMVSPWANHKVPLVGTKSTPAVAMLHDGEGPGRREEQGWGRDG